MRSFTAPTLLALAASAILVAARPQPPARPAPSTASAETIRLNNLGVATMNQQKFEAALPYFEQAAASDPSFLVAQVNAAIALINLQQYEAARERLTAVLEREPQNARALYNLGLLTKSTGETEASLDYFQRAAAARPADAHAQYFVGLMAAQLGRYEEAVKAFERALALDPFLVSAEFGLARAYQRAGDAGKAREHIERFQRLTTEKIASAMSLTYGDQGPLSLAAPVVPEGGAAPPAVAVTFERAPHHPLAAAGEPDPAAHSGLGAGGCFFDADGDGLLDYVALNPRANAPGAKLALFRGSETGFSRVSSPGLAATRAPLACAAADYDNDERPDLAVSFGAHGIALYRNEGGGAFEDVTEAAGLSATGEGAALGITFVDYDHDADADLIVPRAASIAAGGTIAAGGAGLTQVWRNNGNGTFVEVAAERGLAGSGSDLAAAGTDFNNDRAIDLVFTGEAAPRVYLNPREGAFRPLAWPAAAGSPTVAVTVLDFNKDGWMDLAFTHAGAPGVSLWANREGRAVEQVPLPATGLSRGWGLSAADYDNDGWIDLVAAGEADGRGRLAVLRNAGGTFTDATGTLSGAAAQIDAPRAVLAADLDRDRDADFVVTQAAGGAAVVRNEGGSANQAIRIVLKGLNDNRSGVGTKVEVQAGTTWQKFETVAGTGFLGQSSPDVLAGIGSATQADVVRLLWPTGVVQDEVQLAAAKPAVIEQVDRRGSSCPVLFTWNGREYEFITDAIGPAVLGHWVAPGQRNVPDPNEYVKVEGRQLVARDGVLSVKFVEPMEEVIYLDQVKLIAVDHPAGTEIHPHEYFAATAPPPDGRVFGVAGARPPAGAWDGAGRDVLPLVRARDGRYLEALEPGGFKGFAKPHVLELDLGTLPSSGPVRLIMAGLTDYFTATSVFAAHQANVTAIVPYLDARTAEGEWVRVSDDIGFPAGLRRTMTVDLTGRLPVGTSRVRIGTNLKIYWDQILVDTTPEAAVPMRRTEVPLLSAELGFRGFPREVPGRPAADLTYVYDQVSRFGPWARHRGHYTRYGDVTPLVTSVEDRFAIFGAGEEVALEFDARALPPLPAGWTRDYLVYLHGYVKDMDFYAAHAQTVTPLPFAAMGTYPYPDAVRYPDRNGEYLLEWNTRSVEHEAWPSYRQRFR